MEAADQDYGAVGQAALSRPYTVATVLADDRSRFRDSGVCVRRYEVTQLDSLRRARVLTYSQWCAARHATALWRGAALLQCVTSRYEEWVSGARGRWVSTDEADDEALPWRHLLSSLPAVGAAALEAMVMNTVRPRDMDALRTALDSVARDIGA